MLSPTKQSNLSWVRLTIFSEGLTLKGELKFEISLELQILTK
jgi:hypothetical protein